MYFATRRHCYKWNAGSAIQRTIEQFQPAYLQRSWQPVVHFLVFILRAVRVVKVEQSLVVLLQELKELWIFALQAGQLVLVLRGLAPLFCVP